MSILCVTLSTGESFYLPPEVILSIVYNTCEYKFKDRGALWRLCSINRVWHSVMIANRREIMARYTLCVRFADGLTQYMLYGMYHSLNDEPSVIWADGSRFWYSYGNLHRTGGLPAAEYADGTKEWVVNGKLHRVGGPAVICADGMRAYYEYGNHKRTFHK